MSAERQQQSTAIAIPADVRLPANYEAAKAAIAACYSVDECLGWQDAALKLAAYSAMANDRELETMAVRIRARAVRRLGELLEEVPPASGNYRERPVTRGEVATAAGLSRTQMFQAIRTSRLGADQFESMVEATPPKSVPFIARQGARPTPARRQSEATALSVKIEAFARELGSFSSCIDETVRNATDEERARLHTALVMAGAALYRVVKEIEQGNRGAGDRPTGLREVHDLGGGQHPAA